jgi:hypothetical protein
MAIGWFIAGFIVVGGLLIAGYFIFRGGPAGGAGGAGGVGPDTPGVCVVDGETQPGTMTLDACRRLGGT